MSDDTKKMKRWDVHALVVGGKFIGTFEAETAQQAEEMAWRDAGVYLCHQCARECDDAQIDKLEVTESVR